MRIPVPLFLQKNRLLLIAGILLIQTAAAQHGQERVRITTATTDIASLAKNISAQTGLKYSLNMQNASLRKTVTIRPGSYRLSDVLEQIKKQAALQYKLVGTHILFIDYSSGSGNSVAAAAKVPAKKPVHHSVQKYHTAVTKHTNGITQKKLPVVKSVAVTDSTAHTPDSASFVAAPVVTPRDTTRDSYLTILRPLAKTTPVASVPLPVQALKDTTLPAAANAVTRSRVTAFPWTKPLLRAGVSSDELFYAGAQLHAGLSWIYGIAAVGTSFSFSNFRWGGGLSLQLTEKQQVHLNFTTGTASRHYDTDSFFVNGVQLKETLHRLGAAWSKQFAPRLSVHVQLHYNLLHKAFTVTPLNSSAADVFTGNYGEQYSIFRPPYTLRKTVNDTSADKSWIGAQLSLFYSIL